MKYQIVGLTQVQKNIPQYVSEDSKKKIVSDKFSLLFKNGIIFTFFFSKKILYFSAQILEPFMNSEKVFREMARFQLSKNRIYFSMHVNTLVSTQFIGRHTQRIFFEFLSNQPEIRLYLQSFHRFWETNIQEISRSFKYFSMSFKYFSRIF